MPKLVLKTEKGFEKTIEIEKEIITIGRDDPAHNIFNDISLDDKTVSRRHARIVRRDNRYFIEDLESLNGTFVNNLRIKEAKLKHGDLITVGINLILYHDENFGSQSDFIIPDEVHS
ncbi:MAG: FHA domain-containing protein, partial [candidate division WOR-3 bacterium]